MTGDHRILHVQTHSSPTRRSSDLFLARPPGHAAENLLYDIFRIFMPRPSREDVLRPIWEKRGQPTTGHVFLNRFGNPYSDTRKAKIPGGNPIKNQHATACTRAGIEDFTVHDWRHHRASQCVMEGIDLITKIGRALCRGRACSYV